MLVRSRGRADGSGVVVRLAVPADIEGEGSVRGGGDVVGKVVTMTETLSSSSPS